MFVLKKIEERAAARKLRREGRSLREIAWQTGVSLSSASVWVRDIPGPQVASGRTSVDGKPDPEEPGAPTRVCSRCRRKLPETAFNRHPSGRQWWCRECFRLYFRRRGDRHREQSAMARTKRQEAAATFIREYLAAHACADCGEKDPVVLEFDHVGRKRGNVSRLRAMGYSLTALKRELDECEVVCVNCHRRRSASRKRWRRGAEQWWRTPAPKRYETARNLAFAYSYLERTPCRDCGEADICVLDFDHVGPKSGTVLQLARDGVGLVRVQTEITNCEVRCANCHRRRHAGRPLHTGF